MRSFFYFSAGGRGGGDGILSKTEKEGVTDMKRRERSRQTAK